MADKKISQLTAATLPLSGTEVLPIVQSGTTVKVANNNLRPLQIQSNSTSGVLQVTGPATASTRVMTTPDANFTVARTDAAQTFTGNQNISSGDLTISTVNKGVNFVANSPASGKTTQLLNWYEEGTWDAVLTDGTNNATMGANAGGYYTRVGNLVFITGDVFTSSLGSVSGAVFIEGLPFTVKNNGRAWGGSGSGLGDAFNITANQSVSLVPQLNTTRLKVMLWDSATGTTPMQASEWSADGELMFACFYVAA